MDRLRHHSLVRDSDGHSLRTTANAASPVPWSVDPTSLRHAVALMVPVGEVWFVQQTSGMVRWPVFDNLLEPGTDRSTSDCPMGTSASSGRRFALAKD